MHHQHAGPRWNVRAVVNSYGRCVDICSRRRRTSVPGVGVVSNVYKLWVLRMSFTELKPVCCKVARSGQGGGCTKPQSIGHRACFILTAV